MTNSRPLNQKKNYSPEEISQFTAKEKRAYGRKTKTFKRAIDKEKLGTKGYSKLDIEMAKVRYGAQ